MLPTARAAGLSRRGSEIQQEGRSAQRAPPRAPNPEVVPRRAIAPALRILDRACAASRLRAEHPAPGARDAPLAVGVINSRIINEFARRHGARFLVNASRHLACAVAPTIDFPLATFCSRWRVVDP